MQKEMKNNPSEFTCKQFYLEDYSRTLFPLSTNRILVENGEMQISKYLEKLLSGNGAFLPQRHVYAAKDALHLRRTVKLDVIAEYFIYSLMHRNRKFLRKPHSTERKHFGYRFDNGRPLSASTSYKAFKEEVYLNNAIMYKYFIGFDIASYFNHIYHHDLVEWLAALGAPDKDVLAFGKFLREANAGRSLDCLPHGLYPTKMIGNDFLRFIEESHSIKSPVILRFMDDFCLFSNEESTIKADFAEIQRLLGQKSLSVNGAKTSTAKPRTEKAESDVSALKAKLLQRRRLIISSGSYDGDEPIISYPERPDSGGIVQTDVVVSDEMHMDVALELSKEEIEYISEILEDGTLEEDDAELILTVMRHHTENVTGHLPEIISRFPHLAKNVFRFCFDVSDNELIAEIIFDCLSNNSQIQEYQLFWFGMMLESYLMNTKFTPRLIDLLFNHVNATEISKAKILEIADLRFGLPSLRAKFLTTGQSDWLSWASAVGSRTMAPAARNYKLDYFKNSSPINALIADIVSNIYPPTPTPPPSP